MIAFFVYTFQNGVYLFWKWVLILFNVFGSTPDDTHVCVSKCVLTEAGVCVEITGTELAAVRRSAVRSAVHHKRTSLHVTLRGKGRPMALKTHFPASRGFLASLHASLVGGTKLRETTQVREARISFNRPETGPWGVSQSRGCWLGSRVLSSHFLQKRSKYASKPRLRKTKKNGTG